MPDSTPAVTTICFGPPMPRATFMTKVVSESHAVRSQVVVLRRAAGVESHGPRAAQLTEKMKPPESWILYDWFDWFK